MSLSTHWVMLVSLQTSIMSHLALVIGVVFIQYIHGKPALPPLPMQEGCFVVTPEVGIFRVEGEAVILAFPIFHRVLDVRNISPPTAVFLINKANGSAVGASEDEGRVQQHDRQLWLLPAKASDSGEYTCMYRNETYCVSGSITLHVFESTSVNMDKLLYPITAAAGEKLTFKCPSVGYFNITEQHVEWFKDSVPASVSSDGSGSSLRGQLMIPTVNQSHQGLYTCQVQVLINNQQYKVSRAVLLHVQAPTVHPPVIVSPLNGTIFESLHGSAMEMFCRVLTDCQSADYTLVTWLVNDQSVESSYLDGRALQGGRRVTKVSAGCEIELRLIVMAMTEEDINTELKCVAENKGGRQEVVTRLRLEDPVLIWLVVAVVAVLCFLLVIFIFLYVIFKHKNKTKMDYILARQNSTF
ncbi:interleukin-1 receptor type 2 [Thalassophryne amazonica]|uniref:interleukin-1 receptor type 2 n=1 Tax=Thalassophryne amazonica TaxID=390379 RepID=UPI001471E55B|nr:interleukin-1 receptor type 2 [Thalassophryne amazonica]